MSGVSAIPRVAWQDPTKQVSGPLRRQPFRQGVVHWEGNGRNSTPADIAQHLRNMQSAYLRDRGYSLGYGFAVVSDVSHPDDGTRWQIRGAELNMASNLGAKWRDEGVIRRTENANDWTGSVLIIGPADRRASPKAAASVRNIFAEWHAQAGTSAVPPVAHGVMDYTTCCGPHYAADLAAGLFDPRVAPQPVPVPPIQGDPDNMLVHLIRLDGTPAVYAQYSGGYKVWIRSQPVLNAYRLVTGKDVQVIGASYRALWEATGPIMGDRPPGVDTYGLPV
jgi:hypothetical protein